MLARATRIPNGRSKGYRPSSFDPVQLAVGTKVEMEHTTDRRIAQRIAMDHLVEDRDYYKKLATIHLDAASNCTTSPRWVRGTVGSIVGAMLGGIIGGGAVFAITVTQATSFDTLARAKTAVLVTTGTAILGAVAGLAIGSTKPQC